MDYISCVCFISENIVNVICSYDNVYVRCECGIFTIALWSLFTLLFVYACALCSHNRLPAHIILIFAMACIYF